MRVREYASAYRTDPNTPEHDDTVPGEQPSFETSLAQRLRDYSDKLGQADMEHAAKEELQRFLTDISGSTAMWDRYWPDGIRHMIDHAREVASDAASTIEAMEEAERHDLRRHERTRMTI